MPSSEDRQARALEEILGQLVFLNQHLRKLSEIKDLPLHQKTAMEASPEELRLEFSPVKQHEAPNFVITAARIWAKPQGGYGFTGVVTDTKNMFSDTVTGSFEKKIE